MVSRNVTTLLSAAASVALAQNTVFALRLAARIVIGRIAVMANRRYLDHSEVDFEVFTSQGRRVARQW